MQFIEALSYLVWSYWRILRTGHYPSSSRTPQPIFGKGK